MHSWLLSYKLANFGLQVMASYGQKTSGDLLLSYGFAPRPQENPHDGCILSLEIAASDPLRNTKVESLQKYGLHETQVQPLLFLSG